MENEFPPNSHTRREARASRDRDVEPSEKKEVRRVTTNKVVRRKKPLYKQFLDAFRPEDNRGFVEYTVMEVLVPGIKDSMADSATSAIEHALGVDAPRRRRRRGGGSYTEYNRMTSGRRRGRRDRDDDDDRRGRRHERETRVADDAREVILETRAEADEVLDALVELISMYDVATMRDLLSLIGEPHNPTHEDWGWYDLRGARAHRISGGYLLDLPRPEPLD